MFSRHAIIRRYTPPTCTLEVLGKSSPLSRWSRQPLLQDVRFRLRFDDPRLPRDQQVVIQGERTHLDHLSEVVSEYVQQFLQQSLAHLPLLPNEAIAASLQQADGQTTVIPSPETASVSAEQLTPEPTGTIKKNSPNMIALKAEGLLSHQLSLGELATSASDTQIELSALQLFDLANALAELETDLQTLPELNPTPTPSRQPEWARIAAVMILTTGVTATGIQTLRQSQQEGQPSETAIAPPETIGLDDLSGPLSLLLSEASPDPTSLPAPNLPPELATDQLPAPPLVGDPESPQRVLTDPLTIPKPVDLPPPLFSPPPAPPQGSFDKPELANLPQLSPPHVSTDNQAPLPLSSGPPTEQPNLPSLPSLEERSTALERSVPQTDVSGAFTKQELQGSNVEGEAAPSVAIVPPTPTSPPQLLDTIPQVAEARQYFQQRWRSPEGLKQTLEYRLILAQDGSLKQIIPLGKAAGIFLDHTGIPPLGATFVSSVTTGSHNPTLRLVLGTDNSVRTFLESE